MKSSLRTTLWLSLLLGALVPTIVVGTYLLKQVSELDRQHMTQTLYLKADSVASDILRQMEGNVSDLETLAQVPDISLTPLSAIFGYQANRLISEYIEQHPSVAAIYIVDRQGDVMEAAPLQAELLDLSAFQNTLELVSQRVRLQDTSAIVDIYWNKAYASMLPGDEVIISEAGIVLAQPLMQSRRNSGEADQQTGTLLVMIPFHSFWLQIEPQLAQKSSLDIFYLGEALLSAEKGGADVQRFLIDVDIAWPRLEGVVTLSVGTQASSLWELMFERRGKVIIMLLLSLLVVSAIAWFLTQRIVEPLRKLGLFVQQYALGRYQLSAPELRYSEFDAVACLLESMAGKVTQEQALLEQRVSDRTAELQHTNQTLQQTLEQLNQTQLQLIEQEKMAALGGLVSGIAHELNTPLGVCVSASSQLDDNSQQVLSLIAEGRLSKAELERLMTQNNEACQLLGRSLQRAASLVNTFKAIAGSDIDSRQQSIELKTWCEQQVRMFKNGLLEQRIQFDIEGDNPTLMLNQRALELVLSSLLDNSIQHGFVQQAHPLISLRIEASMDRVSLYYQDNGAGVSDDNLDLIFNPFFTTGRSEGNVGLGLNQVFNLVNQHLKGEITSYQVQPQGLGFTLNLPCVGNG